MGKGDGEDEWLSHAVTGGRRATKVDGFHANKFTLKEIFKCNYIAILSFTCYIFLEYKNTFLIKITFGNYLSQVPPFALGVL